MNAADDARFWSKVDASGECWLWTGSTTHNGYGQFSLGRRSDRKMLRAHRLAYESLVGPIADGRVLDHLCRVRHCVNPDHVEVVTQGENLRRGMHPDMVARRAGMCRNGHPHIPENRYRDKHCRPCALMRAARQHKRNQ